MSSTTAPHDDQSPSSGPFELPPYPYDRLDPIIALANHHAGGAIDLSIGTPADAPVGELMTVLNNPNSVRTYPPSIGLPEFRRAASGWIERRFGVQIDSSNIGATVGAKEFVAGLPQFLKLRTPERDTVLYPAVSYPSYEMGATLAGCRAVPVAVRDDWTMDLDSIRPEDRDRALCLWVNTPANPTGVCEDLNAIATWGRKHDIPVFSDECYVDFTWRGANDDPAHLPGNSIVESGLDGVIAVHSLSKRSNFAGARIGFYTGDPELVHFLQEIRKHAGLMATGPTQLAAVVALDDDEHVILQRERYWRRLNLVRDLLSELGLSAPLPQGAFYLWVRAVNYDAWQTAEFLATSVGVVASPGEFYGDAAKNYLRVAVVQPDDRLALLGERVRNFSTRQ